MLIAALSLLLGFFGVGTMIAARVAVPRIGPGFWRLTTLIAIALIGLGAGPRLTALGRAMPLSTGALLAYAACVIATAVFGVAVGMSPDRPNSLSKATLTIAAIAAVAALALDPALRSPAGGVEAAIFWAGLASAAVALGTVLFAMLLAHWYLVEPSMPIGPLNRVIALFLGTEIVKLILIFAVVALHWSEWTTGPGGLMRALVLGDALFVLVRFVLGVLSPLALAWMTWKTVQIRSLQSATGILYAAIVFVLFGEVITIFMSLASGRPY